VEREIENSIMPVIASKGLGPEKRPRNRKVLACAAKKKKQVKSKENKSERPSNPPRIYR